MSDPVRNPSEIFTGAQPQLLQYFAILDSRIKGTGDQADESAGKIALLEGRMAVAESDIDDSQSDITALQAVDAAFDIRTDAAEASIAGLDGRLDIVEPALIAAQADIDALQAADVLFDQRIDATEASITGLDGRLDIAEPAIASAQANIAALQAADTAFDIRLDADEAAITSLDGRLDLAEPAIASAQANIAAIDVRVTALEAIGDPGNDIDALENRVGALEAREDSDDISDLAISDRVVSIDAALTELWGIVAALPPGGGGVNIASVSYADGGVPRLVGSIQLLAGDYAAATASVGCGDPSGVATLELRQGDGTVVTTVGGVAGGVQWRTAAAGFTLVATTDLDLVLYSDSLANRAYLRGFHLEGA